MIAAARYFTRLYLLSYRYFAPLLLFVFSLIFVYSVVPNPVMPSYSFTATMLFIVSAWLAFGYIDVEPETQQILTAVHLGNLRLYYMYKLIPLVLLIFPLALIDIVYPILFDKFKRDPFVSEVVIAFFCHISLALLGLAAGLLFTKRLVVKWYAALGGLLGFIAITLGSQSLIHSMPSSVRFLAWPLPPAYLTIDLLNRFEQADAWRIAAAIVLPAVYAVVLAFLAIAAMIRRR